jgi:hypothetical protein
MKLHKARELVNGGEQYLPYARKKLYELRAVSEYVGNRSASRYYNVGDATILIKYSAVGSDLIYIEGGSFTYCVAVAPLISVVPIHNHVPNSGGSGLNYTGDTSWNAWGTTELLHESFFTWSGGLGVTSVAYQGNDGAPSGFFAFPVPPPSDEVVNQAALDSLTMPTAVVQTYGGSFKNFLDPALNDPPRASGSYDYFEASLPDFGESVLDFGLSKAVYRTGAPEFLTYPSSGLAGSISIGLSIALHVPITFSEDLTPDGDFVFNGAGVLRSGDSLRLYRVSVHVDSPIGEADANGYSDMRLAGLDIQTMKVVRAINYVFVETGVKLAEGATEEEIAANAALGYWKYVSEIPVSHGSFNTFQLSSGDDEEDVEFDDMNVLPLLDSSPGDSQVLHPYFFYFTPNPQAPHSAARATFLKTLREDTDNLYKDTTALKPDAEVDTDYSEEQTFYAAIRQQDVPVVPPG